MDVNSISKEAYQYSSLDAKTQKMLSDALSNSQNINRDIEMLNKMINQLEDSNNVKISQEQLQKLKKVFDNIKQLYNVEIKYKEFKQPDAIIFQMYEKDTGKLIKEIPSEKILRLIHNLLELAGLIIDKKA